jgi:uncharacterized repeat protein (TIGR01451 family)
VRGWRLFTSTIALVLVISLMADPNLAKRPVSAERVRLRGPAQLANRSELTVTSIPLRQTTTTKDGAPTDVGNPSRISTADPHAPAPTVAFASPLGLSAKGGERILGQLPGDTPGTSQIAKLLPSDGALDDWFGYTVALGGDTLVVGAYGHDENGSESGSAYVFAQNHGGGDRWRQVARLLPSDGAAGDRFGYAVAQSGDTIVVGAYADDDNGIDSGSAYVFARNQGGADHWGQVAKLTATDGAAEDDFGASVAVSGDTALVGAYGDDDNGYNSGSAYVFVRNQGGADAWGQVAKLAAADGAQEDLFGYAVALSGDTAAVGAYGDDDSGFASGSAYVFSRNQGGADAWGQIAKLTAADSQSLDLFGYAVALGGDTAVVGAYGDNHSGTWSGSAYVFARNHGGADHWGQVAKLTAADATATDQFGRAVAVSANTIVVGAYGDLDYGDGAGSAYVFARNQGGADAWGQTAKLIPADGAMEDWFGYAVALDGGTLAVGACHDDDSGSNSGSSYTFVRSDDGWAQVAKPTPSDGAPDDRFGHAVAVSGDTAVVGAPDDDDNGAESGSAYVFARNEGGDDTWAWVAQLIPSDGAAGDHFGQAVAISGDTVVVGAHADDDNGIDSGSAYVFARNQGGAETWGQVAKLTATGGTAGDHFGRATAACGDTIVVGAYGADGGVGDSGSAYVFARNHGGAEAWGQVNQITASDGAAGDMFGHAVALSGDAAIVGAYGDDDACPSFPGCSSGSAYVFARNHGGADAWGQVDKLTASDDAALDWFGYTVALNGDTAVVGAYGSDDNGGESGSAYVFARNQGGADHWGQVARLTASDAVANDRFGRAVAVGAGTLVVGAYCDDDHGNDSGSAYVFDRNQGGADAWGQVAKVTGADGATEDYFGSAVSISGDTLVVGAHGDDDVGSSYAFLRAGDGWAQQAKPTASDGGVVDHFGFAVAVSSDTAVVGAPDDDDNGAESGSVYVFARDQGGANHWGQVVKLTPSDGAAGDHFGHSVAVSGDIAVAGAYGDDDNGLYSGSAYVFSRHQGGADAWGQVAKLTASDGAAHDYFGVGVAVSGDTVVVGAHGDDDACPADPSCDSGSAYVFARNQGGADAWGQVAKLIATDDAALDWFGSAVAISLDTAVVGAHGDDDNGGESGSAYLFACDQGGADHWGQVSKRTPSDGAAGDHFGYTVAASGDTMVVGAYADDDLGLDSGSAYVFARNQGGTGAWGQVAKLTPSDGATEDHFGHAVGANGDSLAIGAPGDDDACPADPDCNSGSTYVFGRHQGGTDNWGQSAKLAASDGAAGDALGGAVAASGDTAVTGASGDDDNGVGSGSAYVHRFSLLQPDLVVHKTVTPAMLAPGGTVTYTLTFSNAGLAPSSGVVITDLVPISVTQTRVVSSGVAITDTGASPGYVWQVQNLAPDQGGVLTITGILSDALPTGMVTNTARLACRETEGNDANNRSDAPLLVSACLATPNGGATVFTAVQAAVDAAPAGGTVKVAGTCAGVTNTGGQDQVAYIDESLTLRGGYRPGDWITPNPAAYPTTLDAEGGGHVAYLTGGGTVVLENLRLVNGWVAGHGGGIYEGGVALTLSETIVYSNSASFGGGVYVSNGTATLDGGQIISNSATWDGGGLYIGSGSVTLDGGQILSNTASFGGGVAVISSSAAFTQTGGSTIAHNSVTANGGGVLVDHGRATMSGGQVLDNAASFGGGLYVWLGGLTLSGLEIVSNTARWGGGLYVQEATASLAVTGCTLAHNTAVDHGGGAYIGAGQASLSAVRIAGNSAGLGGGVFLRPGANARLDNNVLSDNQAGTAGSGIYVQGSTACLRHTTVARNGQGDGSGLHVTNDATAASSVALTNTIVADQDVGISVGDGNTVIADGILWHGTPITISQGAMATVAMERQHQGDPSFAADGYHLTAGSAAIDRGVDAGITVDIDGQPRPDGAGFDLGADEAVGLPPVNHPPQFTSAPVTTVVVNHAYAYDVSTYDPDPGDVLTITALLKPTWLALTDHGDGSATLSGKPGSGDAGTHAISLRLCDSGGLTDTQSFSIQVLYAVYLPLTVRSF